MSSAIQKRSRGVSVKRPSRSSAAAYATECTSRSSPPSNVSPTCEKTRSRSASERTSHSVTSGLATVSARSRTLFSIRSPWKVNARRAPSSARRLAIAQAIERLLATPMTRAVLPSNRPGDATAGDSRLVCCPCAARSFFSPRSRRSSSRCLRLGRSSRCGGRSPRPARRRRFAPGRSTSPPGTAAGSRASSSGWAASLWPPGAGARCRARRRSKLNTRSASSQAYLARLAAAQRTAAARIERAIPAATVQQRYRVVLNGFTVELPDAPAPSAAEARLHRAGLPERPLHARHEPQPRRDPRRRVLLAARAARRGDRRSGSSTTASTTAARSCRGPATRTRPASRAGAERG